MVKYHLIRPSVVVMIHSTPFSPKLVLVSTGSSDFARASNAMGDLLEDHVVDSIFWVQNEFLLEKYS